MYSPKIIPTTELVIPEEPLVASTRYIASPDRDVPTRSPQSTAR